MTCAARSGFSMQRLMAVWAINEIYYVLRGCIANLELSRLRIVDYHGIVVTAGVISEQRYDS